MKLATLTALALTAGATIAHADVSHAVHQEGVVLSKADRSKTAAFDILAAHVHRNGRTVTFHMTTNGTAGSKTPEPAGELAGAPVLSYVWPTSLDPSMVGFEGKTGILALAATSHPDFDDTPLYDEDGDGDPANDGTKWHSHWVVLTPTEQCGEGALGRARYSRRRDTRHAGNLAGPADLHRQPRLHPLVRWSRSEDQRVVHRCRYNRRGLL